jgi:hypothetical protein
MYKSNKNIVVAIIAALSMGIASGGTFAGGFLDVAFPRDDFPQASPPTVPPAPIINNPYWPLNPDGMSRIFTYVGETEDECVIIQISVNDSFYGKTHILNGAMPYTNLVALQVVDTEWVFDLEELENEVPPLECSPALVGEPDANDAIEEKTLDWYMQDAQKNIWYVGEYSQSFEDLSDEGGPNCSEYIFQADGVPPECKEGSWEAGKDGDPDPVEELVGQAGIVVPGDVPIDGEPLTPGTYYMQEVAYEAEDMAKILKLKASVEDAYPDGGGNYENCRKVKEWTALEPGGSVEHKWYCQGPGLVLIEGIGGGRTEIEELDDISPTL